MLKYLVTLFIGLLSIFSFAYYEKYSVIQINTFSDKTITSVINANGDVINASEVQFDQLHGYPSIDDHNDANAHYVSYHKGRFLAWYKNEYCLIDTNCRIVIDFCDTIVSIFLNPRIYERAQSDVFFEKFYLKYGYDVYYQAIKNGATFLYNNSGEKIFANSYTGILFDEEDLYVGAEYYYTRNFDYSGFGLLDKFGNTILGNNFGRRQSNHGNHCEIPSNYYVSYQTGIFNLVTKEWEIFDTTSFGFRQICNHVYLFRANYKYGLFDIVQGMILAAEYDTIIIPDEYYHTYTCKHSRKSEPLILKYANRQKYWHIPKKYWLISEDETEVIN